MEALAAYEDQTHQVTPEQVRTYLGEEFSYYYGWEENILSAYLVDLEQNGSEELALFYDSGGTAGFAQIDIWQVQEDQTAELLHSFPMLRGYANCWTMTVHSILLPINTILIPVNQMDYTF